MAHLGKEPFVPKERVLLCLHKKALACKSLSRLQELQDLI